MYKLLILVIFPFFAFSDEAFPLAFLCSNLDLPDYVLSPHTRLENFSCGREWVKGSEECKNDLRTNQDLLIEKGWTQQQLIYLGYHVTQGKQDVGSPMPYTKYINENMGETIPSDENSLLSFINKVRTHYELDEIQNIVTEIPQNELDSQKRRLKNGKCGELFLLTSESETSNTPSPAPLALESSIRTDESVTEAGSVCVDCLKRTQVSEIDRLRTQVVSFQEDKKGSVSVNCTTDAGSSFSLHVEGPFPCPQVEPYNCTQCSLKIEEGLLLRPLFMHMTCSNENKNGMSTSGLAIESQQIRRIDKLGMSCISVRNNNPPSQNQNSRNSQSR